MWILGFCWAERILSTHQTFLSANAVYLLVIDISEDFKSKTYENMIEKEFDSIGEYIDFWLDNIHCYCTDDKKTPTQGHILNPPVIIVGTGIDKIPGNDRKERKLKFIKHLTDTMSTQPKRRHFRKPYFLSNKFPSDYKEEFLELRKDILRKAKDLSNWEENLPARWVVLEKAILHNDGKGKMSACENRKVILYTEAQCLADKCSFPNVQQETSELNSFLKYEHAIGNIVFFKEVKEYIVLDPEWLVDVFRCFVSHDYNNDTLGMIEWEVLSKTGKLEDTLIETLLQKVPCLNLTKHKHYLLELMEEFGIIVKPKNYASRNDIYMPCMIKPMPFQEIFGRVEVETKLCKKSSWLCLVFNFLPPSYFNHVLVSFVKNNPLFYDTEDSRLGIYRNVGIFQLNNSGSEILVICLSKNLIAMKVLQFNSSEDVCYSNIKTKLINLVDSIKLRYRINVTYEIRFKCHGGSLIDNKGIGYDEALEKSEYLCTEHKRMHLSKEIYRFWLKEEEVEDELKKKGRRRCNYCKNMSVYKCYDCNKVLCKDCSRKHDNEEKYISHAMQPISDTFIMNCKWQIEQYVCDIECLPNGEIIVTGWLHPQIILFSVSGKQRAALQLESKPRQIVVVDKTTVAVFLLTNDLAIVDIQQNHVQYIRNNAIPNSSDTLIYIENEFYISNKHGIVVIDMSGSVKRRITLSFTPCDMGYDVDSQRIYCIVSEHSQLVCIDRDGNDIFTFTNPNMTNLTDLTIDNEEMCSCYVKRKMIIRDMLSR
ncbi:unnamed protein product [Mytilus edulis]|uniref:B box-type domain-containing protein n=1 Tax=Mytilus edulis TaxID=6550 RepID=A0A8S3TES9_MYTED|nr:unnamed protein product [Mytilus edulis]